MLEQQLSFPGFEPSPELDFLFFAVLLAAEDAQQIVQLRARLVDEYGLTGQPIAAERLHVSLHTIGAWHGLSPAAVRAAKQVGALLSQPPFEIVFDRAMSFAGQRAFVLRTSGGIALTSLHHTLGVEMKQAGIGRCVTSRFTPQTERSIEPVRWTVRDFALVHSLRGRGASKHIHLARWPLRD
jgi:2'-5' RNA ligase